MEENIKGNLYTEEDLLEYLYNMCDRCHSKDSCKERVGKIVSIQNKLFFYRNKKINMMMKKIGISF